MRELWPTFCSTCGQRIGYSWEQYPAKSKIYCSVFCVHEQPVTSLEERNDAWQVLRAEKATQVEIGKSFGSPHGLVYKVLNRLLEPVDFYN